VRGQQALHLLFDFGANRGGERKSVNTMSWHARMLARSPSVTSAPGAVAGQNL
jgi:hypothetical protein